jgi:hypothetical protein
LFNAHYPISLRSKEKELIRMFEIVLGRGKWTCLRGPIFSNSHELEGGFALPVYPRGAPLDPDPSPRSGIRCKLSWCKKKTRSHP